MLESPLKKLNIVNYLLIAFILSAALLLTRDIISLTFSKKEPPMPKTESRMTTDTITVVKDIMGYASILEKNPFGAPMKLYPVGIKSNDKQNPLSELILIGTATGPKNLSYAIFVNKSQSPLKQEVFAFGKDVYGYGTLTKIEKVSVELKQGTTTYTIPFMDTQVEEVRTNSPASPAQRISEKQYLLDQRKVQRALNNPEQILSDARLYPNIKNGKQQGFIMQEVKSGGLYENIGLRNGDTLLRINGLELSNPEAAIQAMSALKGMNTVNLDIIRNNSKMTINYQIR